MKKIINSPETLVNEMCVGMVRAHPSLLTYDTKYRVLSRKQPRSDKVCLISGGGSGHEPAHGGFVGSGMLDAAVCGDVFASPSTIQVYNAIVSNRTEKGTLLIIKNYTGDCLNFEAASEMAREDDGIQVEPVYVNDDVAVKDSLYTIGRRGVAGTIFVHKIAGAAAEAGCELSEVRRIAQKVIDNVASIGFALTSCTVPAKGTPTFSLGEDEIEFGVGIHGEPGVEKRALVTADCLAHDMLERIILDLNPAPSSRVAIIINGMGATPLQELYVLNNSVGVILDQIGVQTYRTFIGNFVTSIDMAGASVSLLKLDEELIKLLDSPADTPAFKSL